MSLGALGKRMASKRDWNRDGKKIWKREDGEEWNGWEIESEMENDEIQVFWMNERERERESKRGETATSLKFGLLGSNTLFSSDYHDCVHHNVIQLAYFLLSFTSSFLSLLALNGIHSLILSGKVNEKFSPSLLLLFTP